MLMRLLRAGEGRRARAWMRVAFDVSRRRDQLADGPAGLLSREFARVAAGRSGAELDHRARVEVLALGWLAAEDALDLSAHPVQVACAWGLIEGSIVEVPTGEGKTLAAALAAPVLAVEHGRVNVLTVNDYLAERDAKWMQPFYDRLGLESCFVAAGTARRERRARYGSDVVYSTHLELGFDHLRDGLVTDRAERCLPSPGALVIDEADSVLIDEARLPLVLSGPSAGNDGAVVAATRIVETLEPGRDYDADESRGLVWLTDAGFDRVERDPSIVGTTLSNVDAALRARHLLRRDQHYIVRNDRVELVDEYRARVLEGRSLADGLHQAVEAKERLAFSQSRTTWARMTVADLVGHHPHRAGMTGTASEVARELASTHQLDTVVLAPHRSSRRVDHPDVVHDTLEAKLDAVIAAVTRCHRRGRPVLIGCMTVKSSITVSRQLTVAGLDHELLNAADDEREATVIADAGARGAITVATHMAGRGVDIVLDDAARDAGGLAVIGAERFESPRIERQLRGRAGRQGDPGDTWFHVSPHDTAVAAWRIDSPQLSAADRLAAAQENLRIRNEALRSDLYAYGRVAERQRRDAQRRRDDLLGDDPERLSDFDEAWRDHLAALDAVQRGIHFRAWGGETPLSAFTREANQLYARFDGTPIPSTRAQPTDGNARGDPTALGPRRPEPPLIGRPSAAVAQATATAAGDFGSSILLDIVAVADIDGRQAQERTSPEQPGTHGTS